MDVISSFITVATRINRSVINKKVERYKRIHQNLIFNQHEYNFII